MAEAMQERNKAAIKSNAVNAALQNVANQRSNKRGVATADQLKQQTRKRDLQIMSTRRWKGGDVYSPHDLSMVELRRWKGRTKPDVDVFDTLALNPLHEWKAGGFVVLLQFAVMR